MIPAKIDPMSITAIKEKGVESIVDWFEQHKRTFYTLGWCYLRDPRQMEELFYRSIIKVHKELPRFNRETSFEMWITSIFLHTCRELSDDSSLQVSEEGESSQDLFKALDQLKADEKEAVVLRYVKGIPQEEAAHLLQDSVEKFKELLFSGIQSLRKEMGYGSTFNGCEEYHKDYIDYLGRNLDRPKKIDFEVHLYHCQNCQEDLGTFQDVMVSLTRKIEDFHVPAGFMENVKDRLAAKEKHRQKKNKKRKRMGFVFASVCALLIGIEVFTGSFTNLYYTWTEEDQQLRTFLQHGLGKRLNLEAESNGVKIKIKSAIADDVQTLVFYEIEDTEGNNQYMMNYDDGVFVENEHEIMNYEAYLRYYPSDLKSDLNNKEKNVYQGKIGLLPLTKDKGTIKLKITTLQKLIRDSSDQNNDTAYENAESETGEWNFEIPVTKQPSTEYALDQETEVEGIPVRFDKLTIAPTATILDSAIHNELPEKRIEFLNLDHLNINNKRVEADLYGSYFSDQNDKWSTFQTYFDPFFGERPKKVNVQFQSVDLTVEDQKTIELDDTKEYPQTFEYAGSTISIDKVEVGDPTKVVISNHEIENREYEWIYFNVVDEDAKEISSMEVNSEGVVVDKNGIKYDMSINPFTYEEIEQPRYFFTVQNITLYSDNAEKKVIPKRLEIYEYSTTKYLDDVVKISLE
ncbi:sigma-70 family RNA polymerase sigma factor [Lederbergia sp. NSJ-179]|uniref:sigma-70 family RNA polymerase sigma factor n=1 Tax=Lederbergia sp. NSJ-179 TaxID=2931402 RepID=UPI001FD24772|nr:sigma-70 family RNA polymerase sigma factor [Lederbergia sp. NSJ-179]MCJ7842547.1 sigma-70 family RNA polymerase sigma factor [Lederbergia sp. NSJ-179]